MKTNRVIRRNGRSLQKIETAPFVMEGFKPSDYTQFEVIDANGGRRGAYAATDIKKAISIMERLVNKHKSAEAIMLFAFHPFNGWDEIEFDITP